jgi:hypothetical protein
MKWDNPGSMSQSYPQAMMPYKEPLHTAQWTNLNAYAKAAV